MKKLIIGILVLIFISSNLFAEEILDCAPVLIKQGDFEYKYSNKESLKQKLIFRITDNKLSDGKQIYKYRYTYKNVDYYKNKNNHLEIGILTKPIKNNIYKAIIFNYKEKNPKYIVLVCVQAQK